MAATPDQPPPPCPSPLYCAFRCHSSSASSIDLAFRRAVPCGSRCSALVPSNVQTRSSANVVVWMPDGRRCLTGTQGGEFTMWGSQSFQFETILQVR